MTRHHLSHRSMPKRLPPGLSGERSQLPDSRGGAGGARAGLVRDSGSPVVPSRQKGSATEVQEGVGTSLGGDRVQPALGFCPYSLGLEPQLPCPS